MPEVRPLRALYYDQAVAGPLAGVVAPPYDTIDAEQRAVLAAKSPFNAVSVDLPRASQGGQADHDEDGAQGADAQAADPYVVAGATFAEWQQRGALVRDAEPAIWAHAQDYTGPDGVRRTRRGFFGAVRLEAYGAGRVRPHERTHPGPREDRLRLMRATAADTSAIFSLYSDPTGAAWSALEPTTGETPWGEARDAEGTLHRLWRVTDTQAIAAVQDATKNAELLIADGHHRYETARAYEAELDAAGAGGDGHHFMLMCLVALQDTGLTVFPTHRLLFDLEEAAWGRLGEVLARDFERREVPIEQLAPESDARGAPLQVGYIDRRDGRPWRLTLKDQAIAEQALADHAEPYRELDTGVLETIVLKGAVGLDDEDISHLRGLRYARTAEQAVAAVRSGECDAAFLLRATPVEQVQRVAAAGENMPPKSTYFYPKLLTGLLFNPL